MPETQEQTITAGAASIYATVKQEPAPPRWATVEIMGHNRAAGLVDEVEFAGSWWVRVQTPALPEKPEEISDERPRPTRRPGTERDAPDAYLWQERYTPSQPAVPAKESLYSRQSVFAIHWSAEAEVLESLESERPWCAPKYREVPTPEGAENAPHPDTDKTEEHGPFDLFDDSDEGDEDDY